MRSLVFPSALSVAFIVTCVACSSSDIAVAPADDGGGDTTTGGSDTAGDTTAVTDTRPGTDTSSSDGAGGDAADDGASDVSADTTPAPTCSDPTTFPSFGKGCTLDANCTYGLHQLDCCGSLGAIGINHAFIDDFNKVEDAYRKTCSVCDCLPKDTRTESGITTTDTTKIAVRCDVGLCKTYVK